MPISDDELLIMLGMRRDGWTDVEIAEHLGRSRTTVRATTNRVRKEDEAIEGRDLSEFYW